MQLCCTAVPHATMRRNGSSSTSAIISEPFFMMLLTQRSWSRWWTFFITHNTKLPTTATCMPFPDIDFKSRSDIEGPNFLSRVWLVWWTCCLPWDGMPMMRSRSCSSRSMAQSEGMSKLILAMATMIWPAWLAWRADVYNILGTSLESRVQLLQLK